MKTISCMNIDENLLYSFGAEGRDYKKREPVFKEGDHALYYFQINEGKVKLNNYNEDGKEFIHNFLAKNRVLEKQCFSSARIIPSMLYLLKIPE